MFPINAFYFINRTPRQNSAFLKTDMLWRHILLHIILLHIIFICGKVIYILKT